MRSSSRTFEPECSSCCTAGLIDLLFVPADSPHFVQNLSDTIAISCNFVDESNAERALEALGEEAWTDPGAAAAGGALRRAVAQRRAHHDGTHGAAQQNGHTPYSEMVSRHHQAAKRRRRVPP